MSGNSREYPAEKRLETPGGVAAGKRRGRGLVFSRRQDPRNMHQVSVRLLE
jgi:hypothetical protein